MTSRGRRKIWIAVLIPWLLSLAGCASEVVLTPDVDKVKPKLVLNEGEFRVVRTVSQGKASCPYLLYLDLPDSLSGRGGDLHLGAPRRLRPGRCGGCTCVRWKTSTASTICSESRRSSTTSWRSGRLRTTSGLFAIRRLTITAEVLEFTEKGQ